MPARAIANQRPPRRRPGRAWAEKTAAPDEVGTDRPALDGAKADRAVLDGATADRPALDCVEEIGIRFLRYGPPLHRTHLGPDRYDWRFADETFAERVAFRIDCLPIAQIAYGVDTDQPEEVAAGLAWLRRSMTSSSPSRRG